MRYSKKHVNEIIEQIMNELNFQGCCDEAGNEKALELIREEHLLIDRRISSLPEYRSDILRDFMVLKLSYKDLMRTYHCSERTVKALLMECAEDDERVYAEIEFRRH